MCTAEVVLEPNGKLAVGGVWVGLLDLCPLISPSDCKDIEVIVTRAWTVMSDESTGIGSVVLARAVCLCHTLPQTCVYMTRTVRQG